MFGYENVQAHCLFKTYDAVEALLEEKDFNYIEDSSFTLYTFERMIVHFSRVTLRVFVQATGSFSIYTTILYTRVKVSSVF